LSGTKLDSRRLAPQSGVGPMDGTNNPSLPGCARFNGSSQGMSATWATIAADEARCWSGSRATNRP